MHDRTADIPPPAARREGFSIPSLDGLRAVSFLIVFLAHAGLEKWVPGELGLTVFFFLSGYLITTLLRLEYDRTGGIRLGDFYLRRVLRIFPPFYLVLSLASLLTLAGALGNTLQGRAVLAQACHLSNYYIVGHGWWTGRAPGTYVYWSLAVEEHFYLLFPLAYLLLRRRGLTGPQMAAAFLWTCGAVLLWRCLLVFGFDASKERVYVATDTRVDAILFGCALAVWGNPALEESRVPERRLKALWLPLGALTLLISFAVRRFEFEQTLRYTLQSAALFPVFIAAIRYPHWGAFRWLNVGWVRFIGTLSYSLYLLHTTVLFGMGQWTRWPLAARGVASLGVSVLIAVAIYYGVERPCAQLRKRLSHVAATRRQARLALAPQEATA
ncbi:MAG: acyltransferase [Armatimonadetes bacterium]|nr:acyltransferase [Armatimonadota bacterium]